MAEAGHPEQKEVNRMRNGKMTRRGILAAGGATALLAAHRGSFAQTEKPVTDLKPGEWSWYPQRALSGPVAVLVSLSDQLAFVYRNGIRIGVSTVSTGRKGYETPTGVFSVLRKEKLHYSKAYNNAAMPDSQFFFGGCALHAGGLPGYPSSHGCVHLPRAFADLVFSVTHNGTPVIVTNDRSGIGSLAHAGLVLTNSDLKAVETMTGNVAGKALPRDKEGEKDDAIAIIVSGADRRLIALRNGAEFINAEIGIEHPDLRLRPPESRSLLLQGILPLGALGVLPHLGHRRLAEVDVGRPGLVMVLDLWVHGCPPVSTWLPNRRGAAR